MGSNFAVRVLLCLSELSRHDDPVQGSGQGRALIAKTKLLLLIFHNDFPIGSGQSGNRRPLEAFHARNVT